MVQSRESVVIDTDPGIDDALAILFMLLSPEVHVRAITLTHGNTSLDDVKRNAVTILNVMRDHNAARGVVIPNDELPVLAVGCERPLRRALISATYFHGSDGLGETHAKGLHAAPPDWEQQLIHDAKELADKEAPASNAKAFRTTSRDAADEILHQLKTSPPLTVSLLAVGPLTNLALAYERDPVTFSRAKRILIMGGAINQPGNVSPTAEFNFCADPYAADVVLATSKGFKHTPEGYEERLNLIEQDKQAPCQVVILPLDGSEDGNISRELYQKYILPNKGKNPVSTFCNAFLIWSFEVVSRLYSIETLSPYDAYTALLCLDMIQDKGDGQGNPEFEKNWQYSRLDLRVETEGMYTQGMCIYDRRSWSKGKPAWGDEPNNVQVILRGNGPRFTKIFMNRVFEAPV
ncbi:Inosine/uridine-preferring nucleoside hydrolase domain-containing protein [Syncephalastrum racemosum]|uniref:Inosine/uridine-preferring nucleoside hydrolase domain-containing protein n=1 Tax=Syncephalastrum racemosum TaxID=13706 RepID=A0A1X2HF19_SYNRA|nr:Inosine/uridine-preferring nucleoside hydrolase domain-containing protein [Syncephalastrum racemosum]